MAGSHNSLTSINRHPSKGAAHLEEGGLHISSSCGSRLSRSERCRGSEGRFNAPPQIAAADSLPIDPPDVEQLDDSCCDRGPRRSREDPVGMAALLQATTHCCEAGHVRHTPRVRSEFRSAASIEVQCSRPTGPRTESLGSVTEQGASYGGPERDRVDGGDVEPDDGL